MTYEVRAGLYLVSTDPSLLEIDRVHAFLTQSYWAEGVSREEVAHSIDNSVPFGLYHNVEQIGFARVITDFVSLAYLADVYVEEAHRGKGLGTLLLQAIVDFPRVQGIRRWLLGTRDAHDLYRKFGFEAPHRPERWMEKPHPDLYKHEPD